MSDARITSYDELPYSCHPLNLTNPDNLACKALFYGVAAPAPSRCRVLELGCGNGSNLMSLAAIYPASTFVGVDYSARQIEQGCQMVAGAGLTNLQLHTLSLAEINANLGIFDYILCHGVFSWVSPENQHHILRVIREQLAPQGVAYVSYNAYPGWHLRGMVRDMLCFQVRGMSDPREKVARARAYLHFLIASTSERESAYVEVLKWEQKILEHVPDTYIFHEHLEDVNLPLYFHQFADRVQANGLQYLGEARFHSEISSLQPEVQAKLNVLKQELLEYEQQIDFLTNATFRRSLICHQAVKLLPEPQAIAITQMYLTTRVAPVNESVNFHPQAQEEFRDHDDALISTTHPMVKAAIVCLAEARPQILSFDALYQAALAKLAAAIPNVTFDNSPELLAAALFRCHHNNLIEVKLTPPRHTKKPGNFPRTTRLARWQAAQQESISNLQHRVVQLNDVERYVLSLLDGTRDLEQLRQLLTQQITSGVIVLEKEGRAVHTPAEVAAVVNTTLALCLQKYAGLFLLCEE